MLQSEPRNNKLRKRLDKTLELPSYPKKDDYTNTNKPNRSKMSS